MAIDKSELKAAFTEAAGDEFRDIPTDESRIGHTFSGEFDARMDDLLRRNRSTRVRRVWVFAQRAAIIAIVVILAFVTAGSFYSGGNPVIDLFLVIYARIVEILFGGIAG